MLLSGIDVRHTVFSEAWPDTMQDFSEAWIIGGDGTLNYFINKYADIDIAMAVFKGGTGNDFHWMLYGDIQLEEQVEKVLSGTPKMIDAGLCNDRLFLNNLGIGFDAKVTKDLVEKIKRPGKASYFISVLKNILFFRAFAGQLHAGKNKTQGKFFMINVCNGIRTGGGFYLAPGAALDDGKLNINVITTIHPLKRLWFLPVIEKGKHADKKYSFLQQFATADLTFTSDSLLHAHTDGEYFQEKKFKVACLPKRFSFIS